MIVPQDTMYFNIARKQKNIAVSNKKLNKNIQTQKTH